MKRIYSFKAYSSSFDTLITAEQKKEPENLNKNVPSSTLQALMDAGAIEKGEE